MSHQNLLSKKCIIVLSLIVAFVCLAALFVPTPGHDVVYWISRLHMLAEDISTNGIWEFPFHIYSDSYSGYGYGAPLFYCDVFLLIPAAMVAAGLPINTAYGFTLAFFLLLRFGIAYKSVKIALPQVAGVEKGLNRDGFLFAFFYSFFPYLLDSAFERAALGELIASAFLPLVLACIYHIVHQETIAKSTCLWLAVGLFGVVCSHVITTVLLAIVIVVYVLFHIPALWKEKRRLWMLIASALLAVCLSAFWVLPFLEQFLFWNPGAAGSVPEDYTLHVRDWFISTEFHDSFRLYVLDDYDTIFRWKPSGFIYPLLLGAGVWMRFRKSIENKTVTKCLLGAWLIVLGISCEPLVKLLSKPLSLIQFPWRILWLVGLFTAVFLTYALAKIRRTGWTTCAILIYLACAVTTSGIAWIRQVRFNEPILNYEELGVDTLYLPEGAWWQLASERGEVVDSSDSRVQYTWERQGEDIIITYSGNVAGTTFQLPLHYYLGYTAYDTVNDSNLNLTKSEIGLVNVSVEDYDSGSIVVSYTKTAIQKFSKMLSVFTWLVIAAYVVVVKWKKRYLWKISEIDEKRKDEMP